MTEQENTNQGQNNFNQFNQPVQGFQNVPNSVGALVLGILSIVFCWCYLLPPVALGVIAIVLANQGEKLYNANPQQYSLASYKNLKAGKICAIIGLSLVGLYLIFLVIYFLVVGSLAFGFMNSLVK